MIRARQVNYTSQDVAGQRELWVTLFSEKRRARASGNDTSVPGKGRKISLKVFKGKSTYLNVSSKRLKISLSFSPATKSDLMNIQCTKSGGGKELIIGRIFCLQVGRPITGWLTSCVEEA